MVSSPLLHILRGPKNGCPAPLNATTRYVGPEAYRGMGSGLSGQSKTQEVSGLLEAAPEERPQGTIVDAMGPLMMPASDAGETPLDSPAVPLIDPLDQETTCQLLQRLMGIVRALGAYRLEHRLNFS